MKPTWLNQNLIHSRIWYTLVTTEEMYYAECKRCKIPMAEWGTWLNNGASATMSPFKLNGKDLRIIAVSNWQDKEPIQTAALLVHEAVHLWQAFCRSIGEDEPSAEFEAYGIQWISQQLMYEFARQTKV